MVRNNEKNNDNEKSLIKLILIKTDIKERSYNDFSNC